MNHRRGPSESSFPGLRKPAAAIGARMPRSRGGDWIPTASLRPDCVAGFEEVLGNQPAPSPQQAAIGQKRLQASAVHGRCASRHGSRPAGKWLLGRVSMRSTLERQQLPCHWLDLWSIPPSDDISGRCGPVSAIPANATAWCSTGIGPWALRRSSSGAKRARSPRLLRCHPPEGPQDVHRLRRRDAHATGGKPGHAELLQVCHGRLLADTADDGPRIDEFDQPLEVIIDRRVLLDDRILNP